MKTYDIRVLAEYNYDGLSRDNFRTNFLEIWSGSENWYEFFDLRMGPDRASFGARCGLIQASKMFTMFVHLFYRR